MNPIIFSSFMKFRKIYLPIIYIFLYLLLCWCIIFFHDNMSNVLFNRKALNFHFPSSPIYICNYISSPLCSICLTRRWTKWMGIWNLKSTCGFGIIYLLRRTFVTWYTLCNFFLLLQGKVELYEFASVYVPSCGSSFIACSTYNGAQCVRCHY